MVSSKIKGVLCFVVAALLWGLMYYAFIFSHNDIDYRFYMGIFFGVALILNGISQMLKSGGSGSGAKYSGPKVSTLPKETDSTYDKMLAQAHDLEGKEMYSEASAIYQNIIEYCGKKGWTQAKEWAEKSKHFVDLQK